MFTIGAHWSPLELEIVDEGKSNMIKKFLSIGAHWSPLELEIVDKGKINLIKKLLTIGSHRSPLEISEVFRFLDTDFWTHQHNKYLFLINIILLNIMNNVTYAIVPGHN